MTDHPFRVVRSETTYRGRVLDVRREHVRLPDGQLTALDVVAHSGAVALLPVDDRGRIWFVRQYRHPAGAFLLELPAGTLELDESPESCAQRELREEIGMAAAQLTRLGSFYLAPGYSTEYMYVFLATGLSADPLESDGDEFLSVEQIAVEQAYHLAREGKIQDAKSLAAMFLAEPFLLPA